MISETQYELGWSYFDDGKNIKAYEVFDAIREYSDVREFIGDLEELIYLEGQDAYRKGNYKDAEKHFKCLKGYSRSLDYITLINAQTNYSINITKLIDLFLL